MPVSSSGTSFRIDRLAAWALLAAGALALFFYDATAKAEEAPPEPLGYRMEAYRAATPATLAGAKVLTNETARALWQAGSAVFVDVMPRPPKPKELPADTIWRDKRRDNVPGGIWLPNVGFGALNPQTEAYFRSNLRTVTRGDKAAAVVIYCQADCWMSWNAAKRALSFGYTNVHWYPEGSDGWHASGWPLEQAEPVPIGE